MTLIPQVLKNPFAGSLSCFRFSEVKVQVEGSQMLEGLLHKSKMSQDFKDMVGYLPCAGQST